MTAAHELARITGVPIETCYRTTNDRKSRQLWNRRLRLFNVQGGLCFWCARLMELEPKIPNIHGRPKDNPHYASFEHLIPKSHGGQKGPANVVMAHSHCNHKRALKKFPHDPVYGKGGPPIIPMDWSAKAHSSMVEPAAHNGEVEGSIPSAPTTSA